MEESLRPQFLERRWQDKLAAGFTNSAGMSGDKLCTLQQLAGFAAQHGMIWISLGQLPGWQSSQGTGRRIALITHRWAATLASLTADTPASANGLPQPASPRHEAHAKRR